MEIELPEQWHGWTYRQVVQRAISHQPLEG
jgi:hypothetical protein